MWHAPIILHHSTNFAPTYCSTTYLHTWSILLGYMYVIMHITYRQSTAQCSHTTPTTSHPCDRSERSERRHARSSWSLNLSLFGSAYCSLSVLKGNGRHGCMWTHAPLIIEAQKSYMRICCTMYCTNCVQSRCIVSLSLAQTSTQNLQCYANVLVTESHTKSPVLRWCRARSGSSQ